MCKLKLYDTLRRGVEFLEPIDGKTIKMYTCGPTVYNYAHIGNFRTYVFEDLLRRTLLYFGYDVYQVMNITDVDDKTIKGANSENKPLKVFTEHYKQAFLDDCQTLNIQPAEKYTQATDYIPEMIAMIQSLIDQGVAYQSEDGNVFFSIAKFPNYGCLSHLHLKSLKTGASKRTSGDEYDKENASDFVLWKAYDETRDGQIFWDSPFGKGRPGWHIECSAMATKALGSTIDLHCGGVDNIFPHHENEIAQSESATGKPFSRHWAHAEHLIVDGKKMSKSLGNFYTLRDLVAKGYTGCEVRYLLLSTHYQTQLNFTLDGLDAARQTLLRFKAFIERLRQVKGKDSGKLEPYLEKTLHHFNEALSLDLNISKALATLFDAVRQINQWIDQDEIGENEAQLILKTLEKIDAVLGVLPLEETALDIPCEITQALKDRETARTEKNWAEADRLRDIISAAGYTIEDSPTGPKLKKI